MIEDDAQDGPDHVDAHRSTCYVISPYIKRASVDHTFYNTDSVLKTMELLLNIPPMNQYDAIATPILDFDTSTPAAMNRGVYTATLPDTSILGADRATGKMASALFPLEQLSAKMDFIHPDSAPAALLNEVIWKSIKGVNSKMPAPRHSGLALPHPSPPKRLLDTAAKDRDDGLAAVAPRTQKAPRPSSGHGAFPRSPAASVLRLRRQRTGPNPPKLSPGGQSGSSCLQQFNRQSFGQIQVEPSIGMNVSIDQRRQRTPVIGL